MKKILFLLISAILLLTACSNKTQEEPADIPYDVQQFDWTITIDHFKGQEEYENLSLQGIKRYKYSETTVFGYKADLVYQYGVENVLTGVVYFIKGSEDDRDIVIEVIKNKVGEPLYESERLVEWTDNDSNIDITISPLIKNYIQLQFSPPTEEPTETASS